MSFKTLTAAALVLGLVPGLAVAQSRMGQMPQIDFAAADVDGSGGLSSAEFGAALQTMMQNGRSAMIAEQADALIAAGDADGDGLLSRDELVTGMTSVAETRQANRGDRMGRGGHEGGDQAGRGQRGERGERGGDRGGDRAQQGEGRGERGGRMDPEQRLTQIFSRIDANSDGEIDETELASAREAMQQRMGQRGRDRATN